jgi:hypothetical protein
LCVVGSYSPEELLMKLLDVDLEACSVNCSSLRCSHGGSINVFKLHRDATCGQLQFVGTEELLLQSMTPNLSCSLGLCLVR